MKISPKFLVRLMLNMIIFIVSSLYFGNWVTLPLVIVYFIGFEQGFNGD